MRVFATRGVQCVTQARTTSSVQSPAISAAGGSTAVANVRSAAACASAPSDTRPGSAGGAPRRHDTISFFALSIIALPGKLAATFTRRVALHGVRMRRCSLVVRDSGDDAVVSASIERVRGRVRDTAVSAAGDVVADAPADAAALAAALAGGGGDAQRAALVELYVSTGGPGWANRAGWLAPNTSVCTWHGVGCAAGASAVVTSLVLPSNQLVGSLPASLSALSGLQLLVLNNSFITGSLPSTIGALAPLSYLDLSNNALVGSIPDALTSLTALTYVDLDTNGLSGSIPAGVGALTALQVLYEACAAHASMCQLPARPACRYLYGNHLGSSIPSTICGLTSVQILCVRPRVCGCGECALTCGAARSYLFSDSLTGSIPACIGNATALQFLYAGASRRERSPSRQCSTVARAPQRTVRQPADGHHPRERV